MGAQHWRFTIPLRLRSLFLWAQADQELDDELRDHVERKTEEYVAVFGGGDTARYAFSILGRIRSSEPKSVGVVHHAPNNPGTFSWFSMPNPVDLVFAGEGAQLIETARPPFSSDGLAAIPATFAQRFTTFVGRQPPKG